MLSLVEWDFIKLGGGDKQQPLNAETTHIFELCPDDWDLIFKFSGWRVVERSKYTQYPKRNPLTVLRYLWRKFHFGGYYGKFLDAMIYLKKIYKLVIRTDYAKQVGFTFNKKT